MRIVKECPICNSKKLSLHIRGFEDDLMKAKMVELKCDICGRWIKWVPKNEREIYMGLNKSNSTSMTSATMNCNNNLNNKKENIFINKKKFDFDKAMTNSELRFERDAYLMKSKKLKQELEEAKQRIRELEDTVKQLQNNKQTTTKSIKNKGDIK